MKVIQVCIECICDCEPITVKVGDMDNTYCCQKGFEKALKDFQEYLERLGQPNLN